MSWLVTAGRELVGLFVDDGSLALLSLLWLAVCGLVLPPLGVPAGWRAAALFLGLAAILAESALRAARGKRTRY
jgi:hypothetical protein